MDVAAKIASISRTEFMRAYNEQYLKALGVSANEFITFREAQTAIGQINAVIHQHGIQSKLNQFTEIGLMERQMVDKEPVWRVVTEVTEWIVATNSDAFIEGFKAA